MNILLLSTLKRKVDLSEFASRSRVIYQLAKGLSKKGHTVSLMGTGDSSIPGVTIIPVIEKGWVDLPPVENAFLRENASLLELTAAMRAMQNQFDIIHNHTYPDFFPSVVENELRIPLVTTLHALYDTYMDETLTLYPKTHFVALSEAYKNLYQNARIQSVVYNGVDTNLYAYQEKKGDYLFWLGRLPKAKNKDGSFMDPKGVRHAIALARETGVPLKLAGVVEDPEFFERDVKPFLNEKIQWVGEVAAKQSLPVEEVVRLMQNARAFLMTINQEEPFGLVMAEAGSCGTPVIAFDKGSVREIVKDGVTGCVVDPAEGVEGLRKALARVSSINPEDCRKHVEAHFTIEKMVENYEKVYQKIQARI